MRKPKTYYTNKEYKRYEGIIDYDIDHCECCPGCKIWMRRFKTAGLKNGCVIRYYHNFRDFKNWKHYRKTQYKNV